MRLKKYNYHNTLMLVTIVSFMIFLCIIIYCIYIIFTKQEILQNNYNIIVSDKQTMKSLAATLKLAKIIKNERLFLVILSLTHKDTKIKAGIYNLNHAVSLYELVQIITNENPSQLIITINEGWRFIQLKQYIDSLTWIIHNTKDLNMLQIKSLLNIQTPNLEGLFYPDTYLIAPNQSDLEIYQIAATKMESLVHMIFLQRKANAMVNSEYELLTLASLIQKETGIVHDMYFVSTVFNNRLRINMKLQNDPAVFYGLSSKAVITRSDFKTDTPYNTYLHSGLTPSPICLPSMAAIKAAANPNDNNKILYFIAAKNGQTKFSHNYQEHLHAIEKNRN